MYLSNQSLLVIIVVGIVAGWLAGRVMEGGGFGLIGDQVVGSPRCRSILLRPIIVAMRMLWRQHLRRRPVCKEGHF